MKTKIGMKGKVGFCQNKDCEGKGKRQPTYNEDSIWQCLNCMSREQELKEDKLYSELNERSENVNN